MSHRRPLDRIAVALDTADWRAFRGWCELFGPRVGVLKVGLEAFLRWGARAVGTARAAGSDVFLDLKLHDIPKTVELATANVVPLGARFLTVHEPPSTVRGAAGGRGDSGLGLLGITYLTSMSEEEVRLVYGLPPERSVAEAIVEKALRDGFDGA